MIIVDIEQWKIYKDILSSLQTNKFLQTVALYGLFGATISRWDKQNDIIDEQQRLTTLTLII